MRDHEYKDGYFTQKTIKEPVVFTGSLLVNAHIKAEESLSAIRDTWEKLW
jgi:hypothetical protein